MADIKYARIKNSAGKIELDKALWAQLQAEFKCSEPTIRKALRGFEGTYLAACIRREALKIGGRKVRIIVEYYNEDTQKWERKS
jgi:hypothetical protein